MSPRRYKLGRREPGVKKTRSLILTAARNLLKTKGRFPAFTLDAVAQQAGVARMTLYYQFGSKSGLLEALYDSIVARGMNEDLTKILQKADPLAGLLEFIDAFVHLWSSDRRVIRRLHALAALDSQMAKGLQSREAWRRQGLQVLLSRVRERYGHPVAGKFTAAVEVVHMLTSFETFDHLAGQTRSPREVGDTVKRLALAAVVLYGAEVGEEAA